MKKFLNPENLILLTIFLLPTYLVKFNIFGIPLNVLEVLILLVLIAWTLKREKKIKEALRQNYIIYIFSGIIFLGLFISAIFNPNLKVELGIIKGWFILPFILAFIAQNIFRGEKKEAIFKVYFYSTLAVAVVSLIYYFLGYATYDGRLKAFFNSPNYLAMYLAPGFIWGIFNVNKDKLKLQILDGIQLIAIAAATYLTKSYAGWLAIFFTIIVPMFFIYKNKAKIFFAVGVALIVVFFQLQTIKLNNLINFNDRSSLTSRNMIWQSAGEILKSNWLFGIGPGNFQEKYLEYQRYFPPYLEWAVPHPHNLYLSFWLSGGILGLVGFLGLIFFWIKKIWREKDRRKYIPILAILLYILIHGLFDTTYFKNDLAVVFWLVILVGARYAENTKI